MLLAVFGNATSCWGPHFLLWLKHNYLKFWGTLKEALWPLFWMGFNCLKATQPLRGGNLLLITKFPEVPCTHLIDLGRMKGWVDLGVNQWFSTRNPCIGNPAPWPLGQQAFIVLYFLIIFQDHLFDHFFSVIIWIYLYI